MNIESWEKRLNDWDTDIRPHLGELLASITPYPHEVPKTPETVLNSSAKESEISEHEDRLGIVLPNSYKQFLRVSNGMNLIDLDLELLPISKVDWVANSMPWILPEEKQDYVSDEKYFTYGEEQDSINARLEYLSKCLAISSELDGYVYLLNSAVTTEDDEWEAWDHGWKYPGAYRYRNFWELFVELHSGLHKRIA